MVFMKIIDIGNFTLYINYLRWQFTNLRSYSRQFLVNTTTAAVNKVLITFFRMKTHNITHKLKLKT